MSMSDQRDGATAYELPQHPNTFETAKQQEQQKAHEDRPVNNKISAPSPDRDQDFPDAATFVGVDSKTSETGKPNLNEKPKISGSLESKISKPTDSTRFPPPEGPREDSSCDSRDNAEDAQRTILSDSARVDQARSETNSGTSLGSKMNAQPSSQAPGESGQDNYTILAGKVKPESEKEDVPGATICQNCLTTTTPLWRRDGNGQILCNACGLFLKLHGHHRPMSLKTDVIKSRNRSRHAGAPPKRVSNSRKHRTAPPAPSTSSGSPETHDESPWVSPGEARSEPERKPPREFQATPSPQNHQFYPGSATAPNMHCPPGLGRVPVVHGRAPHSPQISYPSQSHVNLVRGPMSEQLVPRSPPGGVEHIPALNQMAASELRRYAQGEYAASPRRVPPPEMQKATSLDSELSTKVSELELVNDLLRRRINDLEYSEAQARRTAMETQETARSLWHQLQTMRQQLSNQNGSTDTPDQGEQSLKRIRVDALI